MKYAKDKPSKLSTVAGIAFGTALGLGIAPVFSYFGMAQNPIDLADKSVDREILQHHPDLQILKPFLRDITQSYMQQINAVDCFETPYFNRCYIKREKQFDMAIFFNTIGKSTEDAAPRSSLNLNNSPSL